MLIENLVELLHRLFEFEVLVPETKKSAFVVAHTRQVVRWGFSYEYGPNFLRKTESNQELAISMFITAIQQGRATLIGAIQVFMRKDVDKLKSWARLLE